MKMNDSLNRSMYRLRHKTGYNSKRKNKSYYRKQFFNVLICIIIILIILLIKSIRTKPTEEVIKVVEKTLNYNIDIKKDSKLFANYIKNLFDGHDDAGVAIPVNNNGHELDNKGIIPINGTIYEQFGEEKKSENITIFHRGIKILVSDKNDKVKTIGDGMIIEVKKQRLLGNTVTIDHGDYYSIYGYLNDIYVSEGQQVERGEEIGSLGKGNEDKILLYLEVIENNLPIDPLEKINIGSDNLVSK